MSNSIDYEKIMKFLEKNLNAETIEKIVEYYNEKRFTRKNGMSKVSGLVYRYGEEA